MDVFCTIELANELFAGVNSLLKVFETYFALLLDRQCASCGHNILDLKLTLVQGTKHCQAVNLTCRPLILLQAKHSNSLLPISASSPEASALLRMCL